MRKKGGESSKGITKERRITSVCNARITMCLQQIILPLADEIDKLPAKTDFNLTQRDVIRNTFTSLHKKWPAIFANKEDFLREMSLVFDESVRQEATSVQQ